eukprot:jgi/Mesen1/3949/ME000209S02959
MALAVRSLTHSFAALSCISPSAASRQVSRHCTVRLATSATCSSLQNGLFSTRSVVSFSSTMAGTLLRTSSPQVGLSLRRGDSLMVRAGGGYTLGCTKRNASKKKRARVSGFRARMKTTAGVAVLKRRRAKGRKDLVPQSHHRSGKGS